MAQASPTYDLVLLLDPQVQESAREKILADARQAIAASGEIVRDDDWGDRALAYPIERKADAEYHLLQFKTGAPELLSEMTRTLHITDGILRFRIVKLRPGTPEAPDMPPGPQSVRTTERPADAGEQAADTAGAPPPSRAAAAEAAAAGDAQAGETTQAADRGEPSGAASREGADKAASARASGQGDDEAGPSSPGPAEPPAGGAPGSPSEPASAEPPGG